MLDPRRNYYRLMNGGDTVANGSWGYADEGDIEVYSAFNDEGVAVPAGKVLIRLFHRIVDRELAGLELLIGTATTTGLEETRYRHLRKLRPSEVADTGLPQNSHYAVIEAVRG